MLVMTGQGERKVWFWFCWGRRMVDPVSEELKFKLA
jgi:hypothetical protein